MERFVEKPDLEHAEQMLKAGNYLWNAGIFLLSIKAIMEASQIHAPSLIEPVRKAMQAAFGSLGAMAHAQGMAKALSIGLVVRTCFHFNVRVRNIDTKRSAGKS